MIESRAVWTAIVARALTRFTEGYASEFDAHDPIDIAAFAALLQEEAEDLLAADIAEIIEGATQRIRGEG